MSKPLVEKLGDGPGIISARQVTANVGVGREGVLVVLHLGNLEPIRMKWRDAMRLGQWLQRKAAEARVVDGEGGKKIILG